MTKVADNAAPPEKKKKKLLPLIVLLVVGAAAIGAGAALPILFLSKGHSTHSETKGSKEFKPALISFGEVMVNLSEGRQNRFLRVKLILVVDESQEKPLTELVTKKKAFMKDWLISHLRDLSLEDASGKVSQNRLRREIRDQFNTLLFPDGSEKIQDVLFEEFVIQ